MPFFGRRQETEASTSTTPLVADTPSLAPPAPTASTSTSTTPSTLDTPPPPSPTLIDDIESHIRVPSHLFSLPPCAAIVGAVIGGRRAARAARLRFLAENAHRQPTTVQGWYYYLKTRNYKMALAAITGGGRLGLGLGSALALFVVVDEAGGWARERLTTSPREPFTVAKTSVNPDRFGWRKGPVHFEDGAVAGSVLAMIIGLAYGLPNPVLVRALLQGALAGAATSGLQMAQDSVAAKRRIETERQRVEQEMKKAEERAERIKAGLSPEPEEEEHESGWLAKFGAWGRRNAQQPTAEKDES